MADIRTLKLALLADTSQFQKGLKNAENDTSTFSSSIGKAAKVAAKAFLALGVAAAGAAVVIAKQAISAASDFSEEISKSQVIFGDASKEIKKFAENAANALGQSKTQALSAASTFAVFGKSAGLTGKELGTFATKFVTLASDLASFHTTSPEEAINAIGSALRGEAEPIRKYGVLLNDATLKNEALALGLIKTTKEALTPANKVLAAQAAIYKQTSDAQGDFAKTSDGLANSQRILAANITNIQVTLGESLLPTVLKVSQAIKDDFLPAIVSIVQGLTGRGQKSPDQAANRTADNIENLGLGLTDTQQSAFTFGQALRDLGAAFGDLNSALFGAVDEKSALKQFLDLMTRITDATTKAIEAIDRFKNSTIGKAAFNVSNLVNPISVAQNSGALGVFTVNQTNNFGPQTDLARGKTMVNTINNAAKQGTVNKLSKSMLY